MKTVKGNISLFPGYAQVPGNQRLGTQNVTIYELSLDKYAEFLKIWERVAEMAMGQRDRSLSSLWASSPKFRELVTEALRICGIESPGSLKPVQVEELLLFSELEGQTDADRRGILFRLHQDFPKIPAPMQDQEPTSGDSGTHASRSSGILNWLLS